jgi:hypothetical protein
MKTEIEEEYRYYFENMTTGKMLQTNNGAEAWAEFNSCEVPCELIEDDGVAGEKYYADPENFDFTLVTELYPNEDFERVDLEECTV